MVECTIHRMAADEDYMCPRCYEHDAINSIARASRLYHMIVGLPPGFPCPCCNRFMMTETKEESLNALSQIVKVGAEALRRAREELARLGRDT